MYNEKFSFVIFLQSGELYENYKRKFIIKNFICWDVDRNIYFNIKQERAERYYFNGYKKHVRHNK